MNLFRRLLGDVPTGAPSTGGNAVAAAAPFSESMHQYVTALEGNVRRAGSQVPVRAALVLFRICDQLREVIDHMDRAEQAGRAPTAHERIAVEFMVSDYLPSTLTAFTISRAPVEQRDASFNEQVDLLWGEVRKMTDAIYRDDDNALTTNAAFLRAKFA